MQNIDLSQSVNPLWRILMRGGGEGLGPTVRAGFANATQQDANNVQALGDRLRYKAESANTQLKQQEFDYENEPLPQNIIDMFHLAPGTTRAQFNAAIQGRGNLVSPETINFVNKTLGTNLTPNSELNDVTSVARIFDASTERNKKSGPLVSLSFGSGQSPTGGALPVDVTNPNDARNYFANRYFLSDAEIKQRQEQEQKFDATWSTYSNMGYNEDAVRRLQATAGPIPTFFTSGSNGFLRGGKFIGGRIDENTQEAAKNSGDLVVIKYLKQTDPNGFKQMVGIIQNLDAAKRSNLPMKRKKWEHAYYEAINSVIGKNPALLSGYIAATKNAYVNNIKKMYPTLQLDDAALNRSLDYSNQFSNGRLYGPMETPPATTEYINPTRYSTGIR